MASMPGVSWTWVAPLAVTIAASSSPTGTPSGSKSVAPVVRVMAMSAREGSKVGATNWTTRLSGVTASRSLWAWAVLVRLAWVTTTPLGRPVEPEV
ncbi:hypothetical protein GCM10029964_080950 [Kibdelosporangium lantanae]